LAFAVAEYNTTGGRRRVTERVGANVAPTLASQLEMCRRLGIGRTTPATARHDGGERSSGAYAPRDLRLAQFAHDHWVELVG